jgi:gamma-F420-2:alpha-L-glutamate ligase
MNGWIIIRNQVNTAPLNEYSLRRLHESAAAEGVNVHIYSPNQFKPVVSLGEQNSIYLCGKQTPLPDFVLVRMGSKIEYDGLSLIRHFQSLGIPIFNKPDSIEKVKDKLYTAQLLLKAGLPFPATMLGTESIDWQLVSEKIGFPLVLKTISGSKGEGVILCQNKEQISDLVPFINASHFNGNFILQQFISDSFGSDIRVFVVGNKAVAAMKRSASDGSFKANFSRGGHVENYPISQELSDLSIRIKDVFKLDLCGIDLLFHENGFMVCEVNSCPGFEGLESCTNTDVAREIFIHIKKELRQKQI